MLKDIDFKFMLAGVVILCVPVLFYIFVISPIRVETKKLEDKRVDLNKQLDELRVIENRKADIIKRKQDIQKDELAFLQKFPQELEEEKLLLLFFDLLNKTEGIMVENVLIQNKGPSKDENFPNRSVEFNVKGKAKYAEINQFLTNIDKYTPRVAYSDLLMSIKDSLTNDADPDITFNMKMTFLGHKGKLDDKYLALNKEIFNKAAYCYKTMNDKIKKNLFSPYNALKGDPIIVRPNISSILKSSNAAGY